MSTALKRRLVSKNRRRSRDDIRAVRVGHLPVEGHCAIDTFDLDMDVSVVFGQCLSHLSNVGSRAPAQ